MRKFSEFNNPKTDQEIRESFLFPEMNSAIASKDHNVAMLENFNKSYTNFNANIEKIAVIQEELAELTKHTENLVKKEELETLLTSHLIFINENIHEIKSNLYGINQNDLDKINRAVDIIDTKTANLVEYIGEELPRNKNRFIEIEYKVDKKITDIVDTFSDLVEYSHSNFVEIDSKFETIKNEVSDNLEYKIDTIQSDFSELRLATKANIKLTENKLQKEVQSEKRLDQLEEESRLNFKEIDSKFVEVDIFKEEVIDLVETKIESFQENFKEIKDTTKANYKLTESKIKEFKKEIDSKFELTDENRKEIGKQITSLYEDIKFVNSDIVLLEKKYTADLIPVVNKLNIFQENLSSFDSVVSNVSKLKEDIRKVVFEVNTIFVNDKYVELDNKIQKIEEIFEKLSYQEILAEDQIKDVTPPREFVADKRYTQKELETILHHASSKVPSVEVETNLKAVTNKLRYLEQAISNIAMSSGGGGEVNLRWLDDVDYTTIADGLFLRYSAAKKKFEFAVGGGGGSASITVANTAPTTNTSGSMWWNTDDGSLYIYYVDETSSQWVPAAPAGKTGVVAVTSPLTYDSANSTIGMSGSPIMNTANTPVGIGGVANSTSLLTLSDTNLAVSANGSALVINQRWNTTGNPTAFKINANNISSGTTTKLMDLQVDGASKFNVDKNGILTLASGIVTPTTTINFNLSNVYTGGVLADGANGVQIRGSQTGAGLGFGINGVSDTFVYRDSTSGILAQRNGTANQTFRLYNTIDNANTANFERASLSFVSYSGAVYTKLSSESGGTGNTNIGLALVPKGTGAVTTQIPDGTITGGNARGSNSFDFQFTRTAANKVVSGARSVSFGQDNIVTNTDSYAFGNSLDLSYFATGVFATGQLHQIQGNYSTALGGYQQYSTANYTVTFGNGCKAINAGQICYGLSRGSQPAIVGNGTVGEAQYSFMGWRGTTTDANSTELFLMGNIGGASRAVLQDKTAWSAEIDIVARSSTGTDIGMFKRRLLIKRETGPTNTVLIGSVQTSANGLPTDITSTANAASWGISLSANTTYGCLSLSVTGNASANVYWVAKLSTVEVMF